MNVIQIWMSFINTVERAKKLRLRVDTLSAPEFDPAFGQEPLQCPTTVLFGAETSRLLYTDPEYRPALDAWDTGEVSKGDIRRWCLMVERGQYSGPTFYPDDAWRAKLRVSSKRNASKAESLQRIRDQRKQESQGSNARAQRPALRGIAFQS